jgi:enolase
MSATTIKSIKAKQVYSDRGYPGIEAVVITENGAVGRAICTFGISIGTHEVAFAFDGGKRFNGRGVMRAVKNVNNIIAPALVGLNAADQIAIDNAILSIMPNAKEKLGGNAIAAVSAAILKAGANALSIPLYRHIGGVNAIYLPVPGVGMVAGDKRYGGGITNPGGKPTISVMCFGFNTFADASYACWDIHNRWSKKMEDLFDCFPSTRDFIMIPEGIFKSDKYIWDALIETIIEAGYEGRAGLQMDVAADSYYNKEDGKYYGLFDNKPKTKEDLYEFYIDIIHEFSFVIIEDPFNEDDYDTTAFQCEIHRALLGGRKERKPCQVQGRR